jgi:NADH:ubiquinone oxidoreductase subunit 6 (subunit J)
VGANARDGRGGLLVEWSDQSQLTLIISAVIAVFGALAAALTSDVRSSGLAIWVCGVAMGSIFLATGSEFVAVVQWISSTLIALGFVLYSVAFGVDDRRPEVLKVLLGLLVGGAFVGCLAYALRESSVAVEVTTRGSDLSEFGRVVFTKYALVLEMVAVTFLLVSLGMGVLARPIVGDEE